ncbi:MAG: hypothetical protein ABI652_03575, partial [Acidobacteriota bacterium]
TLRRRFDAVDVVLFSDHGMVTVTTTTDVAGAVAATGLVLGRDIVYFLDSTMARFWFPRGVGRDRVVQALAPLAGHVLDHGELQQLGLADADPRNAELIFLADPGVLIVPNFFQGPGVAVKGMHGYAPDCADNQGVFVVHEDGANDPHDLGVVGPTAIYAETVRLLGLDSAATTSSTLHALATGVPPARLRGTFTQDPDVRAHAMVREHMASLVAAVVDALPDVQAVVLGGSFGRDEGGVLRRSSPSRATGDGLSCLSPVNDYDIVVVAPGEAEVHARTLRRLAPGLAVRFDIDFVHFSVWPTIDPALPLTLANYDFRYGSRVLFGDPDLAAALPRYAAADIPIDEGLQLICNRLGGLLTAIGWPSPDRALTENEQRYLANQTMKGLIGLGDWHLLKVRAHDVSYQTRQERFRWLAAGLGVPQEQRLVIDEAYRLKLRPDEAGAALLASRASDAAEWLVQAAIAATAVISRRTVVTPTDAAKAYCEITARDEGVVRQDNSFAARVFATDAIVQVRPAAMSSVRQAIYTSLPLIAAAARGDEDAFADAGTRLGECLTPPWPVELTPRNWEVTRQRLSHAWLTLVH